MSNRARIEELEAALEHLQGRVDRLWDQIDEHPSGEYVWNKFEDILAWSWKYDKKSKIHKKLTEAGWNLLDLYMGIILPHKP